jgi:hypothetical protein
MTETHRTEETVIPYFVHDCKRCTFLGNHNGFDLYHCLQGGVHQMPTVIARYGDDGSSYKSGLPAAEYDSELSVARARARAKGLICE